MTWNADQAAFAIMVLGALLGAVITWWFSWFYYKEAGNELRDEAKKLHNALTAVVYLLEHPMLMLRSGATRRAGLRDWLSI